MRLVDKAINYVKAISAETITNAKSGHTGVALGASTILFALFKDHYRFDISDTDFLNRDRFVLSAGHASALYYTLLSMFGFNVSLQDLKDFRKYGSKTPGHPEYHVTDGVEVTTGPLGQGVANAVGMAIAENKLEERFNSVGFKIIDNYVYCLAGDGCLMEGVAQEAISLAGTLKLSKLILLYDSNDVTIDGNLNIANRENVAKKFYSMGWNVIKVRNGNSYSACTKAIAQAKKANKPTVIIFRTTIGIGTQKEGTSAIHGAALSQDELALLKEKLKVKESFYVPNDIRELCMVSARKGKLFHEKWNQQLAIYSSTHPELYKQFTSFFEKKNINYEKILKNESKWAGESLRKINGYVLNEFSKELLQIMGGTADLGPSTFAVIENGGKFSAGNRRGRNIHFGIREHAMGAICNGIALYEDFMVFDSTFLAFANYMMPALKMRAMMNINVMSFFTHDSIAVGEDGPTHQPIEQVSQLRNIIGLKVFRPCDARELVAGYKVSREQNGPISFILTRQGVAPVENTSIEKAANGGYVVYSNSDKPKVVIMASGSEVPLAVEVAEKLKGKKVSVVSMPCQEVFDMQTEAYKEKVIPSGADLYVSIEASNDLSWLKYFKGAGIRVAVDNYQCSGKGDEVYQNAGFESKNIVKLIEKKLSTTKPKK
ncbi:MAG: transketolase [Clostridia bacterium]|nr:transketolase [Clostridia bacterium]